MNSCWMDRWKRVAIGLSAVTAAALALALVLNLAGDSVGGQAALGFAVVTGIAAVLVLVVIAFLPSQSNPQPVAEPRSPSDGGSLLRS